MTTAHRKILLTNARLLDPATQLDQQGQLLIEDGKISALGPDIFNGSPPDDIDIIDCQGLCLSPGFIDMRVFIGSSGAGLRNITEAAAYGGVTTIITVPRATELTDDIAVIEHTARQAEGLPINVCPMSPLTKAMAGQEMTEIGLLSQYGVTAFTDGKKPVANAQVMSRILQYAEYFDPLIIQHIEEPELAANGCVNAGEQASRLGLVGIPTIAEVIMLERDLRLLQECRTRYHAAQLTTYDALDAMRQAKKRRNVLSAGVAVPHFALNETAVGDYRTFAKLSPPLRNEMDRQAIVSALADGTIDVIVSGHDPQDPESKRLPFEQAADGVIGLETLLPLSLELYHNKSIALLDLLAKFTCNPARLLKLDTGTLAVGSPADLCIFDPDKPTTLNPDDFPSKTKNTPFEDRPVQGIVQRTLVAGKTVYEREAV